MKKNLLIFLLFSSYAFSQSTIGVNHDGYVYTNAVTTNPSSFLQSTNPWEVNLISTDVYVHNNYSFISQQSLIGLSKADNLVLGTSGTTDFPKNTIGFNDYSKFDGHFQAQVLGPAFATRFKIKDQDWAAGYYSKIRSFGNAFGLDEQYKHANFEFINPYIKEFKPFSSSFATIQEHNFFVSKSFFQTPSAELNVGVNVKFAKVWDALIVKENNNFFIAFDKLTNTLTLNNYDAEALVATSYDFDKKQYQPKNNGSSFGGDLGLTYIDYGNYDKEDGAYLQKLAFSVTDIGFIKVNGEKHIFQGNAFALNRLTSFKNVNNISDFFSELSTYVYNNPKASLEATSFNVALPTALHLSYSGHLHKNRYLTVGLDQRIPLSKYAFKAPNLLYVNYARTSNAFTLSAQFSLFEYKYPQLGAYLRWGPIFVGSDHILPVFFQQKQFNSYDVYFGIKIYPFWDNAESRRARRDCNCK